jgi:hypothetical protein
VRRLICGLSMAGVLLLAGCGSGAIQDIRTKAKNCETAAQLEKALGKPSKVSSVNILGVAAETWTYKASDGEVTYQILNGKVMLEAAGEGEKK